MKYIIDVPDEAIELMGGHISIFVEPVFKTGDCKHYALRLSKEDIEPYTEPDRKVIEDEVWGFVRIITDMTEAQRIECFGNATCDLDDYLTYQEAKTKYETWKKEKDEIHVGDEVMHYGTKCVVFRKLYISNMLYIEGLNSHLQTFMLSSDDVTKTGRHFSEVEELLKKMGG